MHFSLKSQSFLIIIRGTVPLSFKVIITARELFAHKKKLKVKVLFSITNV